MSSDSLIDWDMGEEGFSSRPAMLVTVADLVAAERTYRAAAEQTERLRQARNLVVMQAVDGGWSRRDVATVVDLTIGRINQIVWRADAEEP
jgi:hypothetical protein